MEIQIPPAAGTNGDQPPAGNVFFVRLWHLEF
jgi:hypothetical protein